MNKFSNKKINKKGGAAAILVTLIFMFIAFIVVFGLAQPIIAQVITSRTLLESKKTFTLADALVDDVIYQFREGMNVENTETLTIEGNTATADISNTSFGKQIEVTGVVGDFTRNIITTLTAGVGASFNYGVQVGNGGFELSNNSGVIGNVYSNGDIIGDTGSFITGSAFAATAGAISLNQENSETDPPTNSVVFAKATANEDFAQSFTVSTTDTLNKVSFFIKKTGSPTNRTVRVVTDSSGSPSSTVIDSTTLSSSLITSNYGWVDAVFPDSETLNSGQTYWLIIDGDSNNTKNYTIAANSSYTNGQAKIGKYNSSWNNTSPAGLDGAFRVYLGGVPSSIDGVTVGEDGVGDIRANTVTNSDAEGDIYCQTGSGNNKTCINTEDDPAPLSFPISDANIDQWKAEALSGGSFEGNYVVSDEGGFLGPIKVNGDLIVDESLVLTGTVWVTGEISADNNVEISLDSGYGSSSGVLLSDGNISLSNNVNFLGSGSSDSFILVITTSDCDGSNCSGSDAINVSNNVGTVVLNAQNGSVNFSNNAGAKSATASLIRLSNNVVITYDSGLADVNFSSGPGGTFNIQTWKEVE